MATEHQSPTTLDTQWQFLDLAGSSREEAPVAPVAAPDEVPVVVVPALLSDSAVSAALEAERARSRERETFINGLQQKLAEVSNEAAHLRHELSALREDFTKISHSHDDLVHALRQAHATVEKYRNVQPGFFSRLRK